jgi:asparagine synthase (glutamine-hydrolysing)
MAAHLNWLPSRLRRAAPGIVRPLGQGGRNNSNRSRIQRIAQALAMAPQDRYAHWMSAFPASMRTEMLQPELLASIREWHAESVLTDVWTSSSAGSRVDRMLDTDVNTYLPGDLLVKMDVATMAYSVEGRSPLLDHNVMEFAASLPGSLKLRGTGGKLILKSALRGVIPDAVLDRPKMGFGVPLPRWFREELRDVPGEILLGADARVNAYVKPDQVVRMIAEHHAGSADHSLRLWVLLQLELWHREVLEAPLHRPIPSCTSVAPATGP